jgi:hypothetical protein
MQGEEPP